MKLSYVEMRESFEMWNRNIKKPSELKEATLYSLEQRMSAEEHSRLSESIVMKDILDKLIYSIHHHLNCTSLYLKTKNFQEYQAITARDESQYDYFKNMRESSRGGQRADS